MRYHMCFGLAALLDEVVARFSNSSIGIGVFLFSKLSGEASSTIMQRSRALKLDPFVQEAAAFGSNVLRRLLGRGPRCTAIEDGKISTNTGDGSFLDVYGQRETRQGLEYFCRFEIWLRAEAGIPDKQIHEYNNEAVRSCRLQSLRKRKHESGHENTGARVPGRAQYHNGHARNKKDGLVDATTSRRK